MIAEHPDQQDGADQHARHGQVLLREIVERPDEHGRGRVDDHGQEAAAAVAQRVAVEIEQPEHERRRDHRRTGQHVPVRHAYDRCPERELGLAIRIVHAPVRTDLALGRSFPGLVERFHQEVFVAGAVGERQEPPQEQRLVRGRGDRRVARAALARPADFADHDRLARKRLLEGTHLVDDVADRRLGLDAFPVGQHVNRDEIDVAREFGIVDPDVPGFRRADGLTRGGCARGPGGPRGPRAAGRRAAPLRCRR